MAEKPTVHVWDPQPEAVLSNGSRWCDVPRPAFSTEMVDVVQHREPTPIAGEWVCLRCGAKSKHAPARDEEARHG